MASRLLAALLVIACSAIGEVTGSVRDSAGTAVAGANVEIRNQSGVVLEILSTDDEGRFESAGLPRARYRLFVSKEGFGPHESIAAPDTAAAVVLEIAAVHTRVVVSATRGTAEDAASAPNVVAVRDLNDGRRPLPTIGHLLEGEPNILVQQSTAAQVSPFLRGLTGYHVLNLVDGIRFNNSTFRSGPNQYLAFLEPTQAQRVEALLGPAGVGYGSDSLGGAIHVITPQPRFAAQSAIEHHGELSIGAAAADLSATASGRMSLSGERWFWLGGASGRRHNDLRAGGGHDSRNVFHRLFGMSRDDVRDLLGSRLQDSGFRQYGIESKAAVRPTPGHLISLSYLRGVQDDVRGYKDLLGGLGRLVSEFDPQVLDWFYGRYEKIGAGPLDTVSGTFSLNRQVDGGQRQGLRATDPLTQDYARVSAYGYTGQAAAHWRERLLVSFGGDLYDEHIGASREVLNPVSGVRTWPRPLYPDNSRYAQAGLFGQGSFDLTRAVRIAGGLRFTGVRYSTREDAALGVPGGAQWFHDLTFQSSVRWQFARAAGIHAVVSRGFRAPNLNDLGALGLNDLGYEIPAAEALPAGAILSTDAGEGALPAGRDFRALRPESLMNYEFGVRLTPGRTYARVQLFAASLDNPIVRRTLLFPAGAVPSQLAGLPVEPVAQTAAQRAQNVVAVATPLDPRAVKAFVNDGESVYYGLEALWRQPLTRRWALEAAFSEIAGRDLNPNRNIRRLPPRLGSAALRYSPSGRRPWFEVALNAAGRQDRLSGGDRDDERIGGSFRRRDIADFYNGTRVSPYRNGGVFAPTNETLAEIQNRVLPLGAIVNGVRVVNDDTRVPLYLSTAGWMSIGVRTCMPLGERWRATLALENLLDRNYRVHGSGVDAPGFNAWLGLTYRF